MSNGLELKAIIDSRIQEIKVNSHTFTKEPSKLHLKTKDVVKVQDVQSEQDNYELQYLSLKRKELQYQMLSQNADYEDDGEGLVDFSKKEITELPVGESEKWVEIVDEFGRNRLIRADMQTGGLQKEKDVQVHYDPNKEIRNLGTSHYQFSKEEEKRMQELKELKDLRKDTKVGQILQEERKLEKTKAVEDRKKRIRDLRAKRLKK